MSKRVSQILATLSGFLSGVGGLWVLSPPPHVSSEIGAWLAFSAGVATVAATVWHANWPDKVGNP